MNNTDIQEIINYTAQTIHQPSWELFDFDKIVDINPIHTYVDHTYLKAVSETKIIEKLCNEAIEYNFHSVCINPYWVNYARKQLSKSDVKTCTVISFPLGSSTIKSKLAEIENAASDGAQEIDFVTNLAYIKDRQFNHIFDEYSEINARCKTLNLTSKVILETCYLESHEIIQLCTIAKLAKLDFVKTSTGFGPAGASSETVKLMKKVVGQEMSVKASGGIKSKYDAHQMIINGADRIGASKSIDLV